MAKSYRLTYHPMFYEDLHSVTTYIANVLENPQAANKLLDETEKTILNRLPSADKYTPYKSIKKERTNTIL